MRFVNPFHSVSPSSLSPIFRTQYKAKKNDLWDRCWLPLIPAQARPSLGKSTVSAESLLAARITAFGCRRS
jgi:hypothetical protein